MGGKILVAEDDPEARELLLLLLEGGEYSLLEASDGMEALDLLRTEQPDLLITDIVMPRMDGYELVRRLREDDRTAHTSVIFCSASYHEREVREMARSLGVQSTLAKPFDHQTVRTIVDAALAARLSLADTVSTPTVQVIGGAEERLSALWHSAGDCLATPRPKRSSRRRAMPRATFCSRNVRSSCSRITKVRDTRVPPAAFRPNRSSGSGTRLYMRNVAVAGAGRLRALSDGAGRHHGDRRQNQPGDFVSMLGVPVASVSHRYGYLCVINRIGLPGFTDEISVWRARSRRRLRSRMRTLAATTTWNSVSQKRTAELEVANRELEHFRIRSRTTCARRCVDSRARADAARLSRLADGERAAIHPIRFSDGAREMSALIDGLLALSAISRMEMRRE